MILHLGSTPLNEFPRFKKINKSNAPFGTGGCILYIKLYFARDKILTLVIPCNEINKAWVTPIMYR